MGARRPLPVRELVAALSDEGSFAEDVGDGWSGPYYETRFVSEAARSALERAPVAEMPWAELLRLLREGRPQARAHAAHLLGRHPEARPALRLALGDPEAPVRIAAIGALVQLRPADDEGLPERVWDAEASVSRAAAEGLAGLGIPPRIPFDEWRERLADAEETQRASACAVLGLARGDDRAAALLVEVLRRDESAIVLRTAAEGLLKLQARLSPAWVAELLEALPQGRMYYARPLLLRLLVAQEAEPGRLAELALPLALDDEPGVYPQSPLLLDRIAAAIAALRWCGEAVRPLLPAVAERLHGSAEVRDRAVALLRELPAVADGAVAVLEEHLARETEPARRALVRAAIAWLQRERLKG